MDPKKAEIAIRAFFSLPIRMIDLDEDLFALASGVAGRYKLSYDSVHIAAMLLSGTKEILTQDEHFKRVKEIRMIRPLEYGR